MFRFFTYGPQAPTALCNGPSCAELQGDWIIKALEYIRKNNYHSIDASEEAGNAWAEGVAAIANMSLLPTTRSVSMLELICWMHSLNRFTVVYGRQYPWEEARMLDIPRWRASLLQGTGGVCCKWLQRICARLSLAEIDMIDSLGIFMPPKFLIGRRWFLTVASKLETSTILYKA